MTHFSLKLTFFLNSAIRKVAVLISTVAAFGFSFVESSHAETRRCDRVFDSSSTNLAAVSYWAHTVFEPTFYLYPASNTVSYHLIEAKPKQLPLSANAAQSAFGIPLYFNLFDAQVGRHVPFEDGTLGTVTQVFSAQKENKSVRHIEIQKADGSLITVPDASATVSTLVYEIHVEQGRRHYNFVIWDATLKSKRSPLNDKAVESLSSIFLNLPRVALELVQQIVLNPYPYVHDQHYRDTYENFETAAAVVGGKPNELTGLKEINFFLDISRLDRIDKNHPEQQSLDGMLLHEIGHLLAEKVYSSSTPDSDWISAMKKDGNSVSEYGDNSPAEDFAESFMFYHLTAKKFRAKHPARYQLLQAKIRSFIFSIDHNR